MMKEIMKIVIDVKPDKPIENPSLGGLTYGTVFSGTIRKVKGVFLVASGGLYRLDEGTYPFGSLFTSFTDDPKVVNYKLLKATLTIENV
jgi:hypothetical protein